MPRMHSLLKRELKTKPIYEFRSVFYKLNRNRFFGFWEYRGHTLELGGVWCGLGWFARRLLFNTIDRYFRIFGTVQDLLTFQTPEGRGKKRITYLFWIRQSTAHICSTWPHMFRGTFYLNWSRSIISSFMDAIPLFSSSKDIFFRDEQFYFHDINSKKNLQFTFSFLELIISNKAQSPNTVLPSRNAELESPALRAVAAGTTQ